MTIKSKTSHFTKRGSHFGNVWYVYSEKNKTSFKLFSDKELAHWILFLEFNPEVYKFKLNERVFETLPDGQPVSLIYSSQILWRNGDRERWQVVESKARAEQEESSNWVTHKEVAKQHGVMFRFVDDNDLVPTKHKLMSLMKVTACLCAGKDAPLPSNVMYEARCYVEHRQSGVLSDFIAALSEYDIAAVLYIFARLYSEAKIDVSFEQSFFANSTRWIFNAP